MPPIVIGSGVSIPQLNSTNVGTIFTLSGNVISQDFTISGTLEISNLDNFTFDGIIITGGVSKWTFTNTTGVIFDNCFLTSGGVIELDDSSITFTQSGINDWTRIDLSDESRIDAFEGTSFIDVVDGIRIEDQGLVNAASGTTFDNSPLALSGFDVSLILQDCILMNTPFAGVILAGGGYYYGKNNVFHDNGSGIYAEATVFSRIEEHDSYFYNNTFNPISLYNVAEIILIDNKIDADNFEGSGIYIEGGNGVLAIEDDTITGSNGVQYGLVIKFRPSGSIKDNLITGIGTTNHDDSEAMLLGLVKNVVVENNQVYDNINANGIHLIACTGAQVISNNIAEHYINLRMLDCEDAMIESNICSYAAVSNIYAIRSGNATFCSNACNHGEDGITIEGTMTMLEMNDNAMTYCERGLVYRQDVTARAQFDKGNYFLLNTLGAEFEGTTHPIIISANQYRVRPLSTEFPSFSPSGWFINTALTAEDCTPVGPVPPIGIMPDVERLISGINDLSPDGKVTNDFMIALEMIAAEPDFLLDPDIDDFNDVYGGSDLDLLLTIKNISTLIPTLTESTPVIDFDRTGVLGEDLSAHFGYLDDLQYDYDLIVSDQKSAILDAIGDMAGLSPANKYEDNYQFAILQYLGLIQGDTLTTANEADILILAEGCLADDGPAIYIAQIVAESEGLNYTKATSCTPVVQRSDNRNVNSNSNTSLMVFPNPTNDQLTLSAFLKEETISIFDIVGHMYLQQGNVTGNQVDISSLKPGIYFFQIVGSEKRGQFVKL